MYSIVRQIEINDRIFKSQNEAFDKINKSFKKLDNKSFIFTLKDQIRLSHQMDYHYENLHRVHKENETLLKLLENNIKD